MNETTARVVIVGGGFGGLAAAKALKNTRTHEVTAQGVDGASRGSASKVPLRIGPQGSRVPGALPRYVKHLPI